MDQKVASVKLHVSDEGKGVHHITHRPKRNRVGKFGSFLLVSEVGFDEPFDQVAGRIVEELEGDTRVTNVLAPEIENDWCYPCDVLPSPAEGDGLITGSDTLAGLRFSAPIEFSVEVPKKNQRRMVEDDDVPTRYQALWNGVLLVVTWLAETDEPVPMSGGHVVSDVLEDALGKSGWRLYVQGCNPECTAEFAHTVIRFLRFKDIEETSYREGKFFPEVEAHVPEDTPNVAEEVFYDLVGPAFDFTQLKNLGRRILEIEADGRRAVSRMLAIDVERAEDALKNPLGRVRGAWKMRGWRRATRREIARVWAALSNIELLSRRWNSLRFSFDREASERGREELFMRDYADEVEKVASFNPTVLRASVEEIATRLDNRALFLVTGLGAIAGAIAGGVVGALTAG